jgi:hypothetical protein
LSERRIPTAVSTGRLQTKAGVYTTGRFRANRPENFFLENLLGVAGKEDETSSALTRIGSRYFHLNRWVFFLSIWTEHPRIVIPGAQKLSAGSSG